MDLFFALTALFLSASILLIKVCVTKNFYEKLLITNSFSTHVVLIISVFSFYNNSVAMIDIALVYAFIGFLATISIGRYLENS
ncbi:MAG: pH regulation protein F [Rickettsiaceae bacterium H1]|nr:pH regulation protein F [Rickettsiaceae bacterium H1]